MIAWMNWTPTVAIFFAVIAGGDDGLRDCFPVYRKEGLSADSHDPG